MLTCRLCGGSKNLYKKSMICRKCYQKEYSKKYYKDNTAKLQANSTKNYYAEHDKNLLSRKKYREKMQFDSKRMGVLERDKYICITCKTVFDGKDLVVHHNDRQGRGSVFKNNDESNLVTSCRACHVKEHHKEMKEALAKKYAGKWSFKYDKCIECGTTSIKYGSKGMCNNCYARYLRVKNGTIIPVFEWSKKHPWC
ncbi:MAG: HNH endonuclease [Clostridium sp.]|nr:HNH endonuclease [Clostridium sp.]